MIKCENLKKMYGNKIVVSDLSFDVKAGEVFGFLGSNGAGKTTTIKMLLGLINKDDGNIEIDKKARIGYSPETPYFHSFLTGYEVMEFFAKLQRIDKKTIYREVEVILRRAGLSDAMDIKIKNYSKGMIQRLALAQALIGNPDLLILDEPTAGLDAVGRVRMLELIGELKKDGKTIILNSHILNDVERIADRGIIINKGRIIRAWDVKGSKEEGLERMFLNAIGGEKDDDYNA
jgi:ABC-2 type transport system ATP-binding protein